MKHRIFIAYNNVNLVTCTDITCMLWFFGYTCHQNNIMYPEEILLNTTLDTRRRDQQEDEENIGVQVLK